MRYYAYALQQAGRYEEATGLLQRVLAEVESIDQRNDYERPVTFETKALCNGLLGNQDGAVDALERAIELGWADYYRVIINPMDKGVRKNRPAASPEGRKGQTGPPTRGT